MATMRTRYGVLTPMILVAGCYTLNPSDYVAPDGAASNDAPTTQGGDVAQLDVPMGGMGGGGASGGLGGSGGDGGVPDAPGVQPDVPMGGSIGGAGGIGGGGGTGGGAGGTTAVGGTGGGGTSGGNTGTGGAMQLGGTTGGGSGGTTQTGGTTGTGGTGGADSICGGKSCAGPEFCDAQPGLCGAADLSGTCVVAVGCAVGPVCGCDGKTYSNDCQRILFHVYKESDGACANADAGTGGTGGTAGTGGSSGTGGGTQPSLNCSAAVTPANGYVTDFSDYNTTTGTWGNTSGLYGGVFSCSGFTFSCSNPQAKLTAVVDPTNQNLHVTGTLAPSGDLAGFGLRFNVCANVGSFSSISFTLAGSSSPFCSLGLLIENYDQLPTTSNPPGGCVSGNACVNFPYKARVAIPSMTPTVVTTPFSAFSYWSAATAAQVVGIRFIFATPALIPGADAGNATFPVDVTIDDVKFVQ
jgi:hypothetical protein